MASLPQASETAPPPARIELILPALNEETSIGRVLAALPPGLFWRVLVADNGSTDRTAAIARDARATVLAEPRRGYGSACLRALAVLDRATEVVVFMDADASDVPSDAPRLIEPIVKDEQDLVLGSRTLGALKPAPSLPNSASATGSLSP
jgi:glycosyltransferase involved in cell wall biosynthesis